MQNNSRKNTWSEVVMYLNIKLKFLEFLSEFHTESNCKATKQTLDKGQQLTFFFKIKMKSLVTTLLRKLTYKNENTKILIIGGGIMGLGSAWYLSQR